MDFLRQYLWIVVVLLNYCICKANRETDQPLTFSEYDKGVEECNHWNQTIIGYDEGDELCTIFCHGWVTTETLCLFHEFLW